jgi:transcriptional regulator with XRE-family HTH domain
MNEGNLSDTLRKAITSSGMTVSDVALRAGVTHASLSYFLHGKRSLRLPTVEKLADFFGMELVQKGMASSR